MLRVGVESWCYVLVLVFSGCWDEAGMLMQPLGNYYVDIDLLYFTE